MRLALNDSAHQRAAAEAFLLGFKEHGEAAEDFAVTWGPRKLEHYLCLEAGNLTAHDGRDYVSRRLAYISVSWDGYGYKGRIPRHAGRRFEIDADPWKYDGDYALVLGQTPGDRALPPDYMDGWLSATLAESMNVDATIYRPHPNCERGYMRSLHKDLDGARYAITYNSNSAVEAVLAGVPTICFDMACAAWPVCSHTLGEIVRPDRTKWLNELTWRNWTLDEIRSGAMWEFMKAYA